MAAAEFGVSRHASSGLAISQLLPFRAKIELQVFHELEHRSRGTGTDVGCVRDNNKDNSGYDRRHTHYRFVREWVDGLPGRSPAGSLSALYWSILTGHAKVAIFWEAAKH